MRRTVGVIGVECVGTMEVAREEEGRCEEGWYFHGRERVKRNPSSAEPNDGFGSEGARVTSRWVHPNAT